MRWPLSSVTITGRFGATGGAYSGSYFKRHIGTDFRASVGTAVYAPIGGTIRRASTSSSGNKIIELAGNDGRWHRFLHLSGFSVSAGQKVSEGQLIGRSGNTGGVIAHLHWDIRKANTEWNASFSNYYNPESLVSATPVMPPIGSKIKLIPTQTRTTWVVGTAKPKGTIKVTDNSFVYVVRGYDSSYPGRIVINSASGGGNGVGLALFYNNGQRIEGWVKI